MDGEVVAPDTFLVRAVEVVVVALPGLPAGGEEHVIQRVFAAAALYLQRSAAPLQAVVRPVGVALRAPAVGSHVVTGPAAVAQLRPGVEVACVAADVDRRV